MKRAQLVTLAIAAVAAVGAVIGIKSITNKPQVVRKEIRTNTAKVLVARSEISLGQVVTESNFKWQAWPEDGVSPGFITDKGGSGAMRELAGGIARSPILQGEPVTKTKLVKPGDGGVLAAILPPGMRAISAKINEDTSAGRLILPNDHVDVILTRRMRSRSGGEEHVSDTLFRNVRILAIGQQLEAKQGKKASDTSANTATLELTPRQAELLALAKSMGEISLALRSIADFAGSQGPTDAEGIGEKKKTSVEMPSECCVTA